MSFLSSLILIVAAEAPAVATPPPAAASDIVAGAETCAVGRMSEKKMLERITSHGWTYKTTRGINADPRDRRMQGSFTVFERGEVNLYYAHTEMMKNCSVNALVPADFPVSELIDRLTAQLGKQPKVEAPNARYLYHLPRLDILTVQILPKAPGYEIKLDIIH